jgi:hypothetical protein
MVPSYPYEVRFPFEHCFVKRCFERVSICHMEYKTVKQRLVARGLVRTYTQQVYAIHAVTAQGPVEIWTSKEVFSLLKVGDCVIVSYQVGRWSRSLKSRLIA